jgi:hypothetical protein
MDFLNPAPAPSPSRRFGPANEVKERLHCQALQRLSGLDKALALFALPKKTKNIYNKEKNECSFSSREVST